jgi:hypothetical protein
MAAAQQAVETKLSAFIEDIMLPKNLVKYVHCPPVRLFVIP